MTYKAITPVSLMMCVIALIVACNGTPTAGLEPPPITVGVIGTTEPITKLAGSEVFPGEDIFERQHLDTDTSGTCDFLVYLGDTDCHAGPDSHLIIRPEDSVAVRIVEISSGQSLVCKIGAKGDNQVEFTAGDVSVSTTDPVFTISYENQETIVKVLVGFMQVSSRSTGVSVLVGPNQQTLAIDGKPPSVPTPVELNEYERQELEPFLRDLILPDPRAIGSGESLTLARVLEEGVLTVAVDAESVREEPVFEFLDSLNSLFEEKLQVQIVAEPVDRESLVKVLAEGSFTAALTPAPLPDASLGPLFVDSSGRVWSLNVVGDVAFGMAYADIAAALFTDGSFGTIYAGTFDREIDYGRLLPP